MDGARLRGSQRTEATPPAGRAPQGPRPPHTHDRRSAGTARRRAAAGGRPVLKRHAVVAVAALGAACGSAPAPQGAAVLRAFVVRAPKDTVRFTVPALASQCVGGIWRGVLVRGSSGANGALVWLRSADSLTTGTWPLLQRGDTVSTRGATVGVRFVVGQIANGVALASGAVTVSAVHPAVTLTVRGAGIAVAAAGRGPAEGPVEPGRVGTARVPGRPILWPSGSG